MAQQPAAGQGSERLYFAFSPFLEPVAFERWRKASAFPKLQLPEGKIAEAVDVDLLFNSPSEKWKGRIAGLTRSPGKTVLGKLYRIRAEDWSAIQDMEGARSGEFVELAIQVKVDGRQVEAIGFATNPARASTAGQVSEEYAEALARGAEAAGLPKAYVDKLKAEAMILERVQGAGRKLGLK